MRLMQQKMLAMKTLLLILQSDPTTAPGRMCAKAQIFVPGPMLSLSQIAFSCTKTLESSDMDLALIEEDRNQQSVFARTLRTESIDGYV